jgi:iron transport multicopper oxidase
MFPPAVHSFACLAALGTLARAGTVTYDWNVTWVWKSPDGFGRPVIGINNEWPCPEIDATAGDTVVINLNNKLGNQTTGLHFHGINQIPTADMDGPSGVTQCAIAPDSSVKYQFTADAPGTYWCEYT